MENALNAHLKSQNAKFPLTPEERDGNIEGWYACKDAILAKINDENFLINAQANTAIVTAARASGTAAMNIRRIEMATFRSKPREIIAEQYTEYGKPVTGMCQSISCHSVNHDPHVHTMHDNQIVFLVIGDWVTPEPDGEHYYPIKPDYMADKYEQIGLTGAGGE